MFAVHTRPEKFGNGTITSQFRFVFEENAVREITFQFNPYEAATLGEMDSGLLKGVGRLMEVKTIEKPSSGL